MALESGLRRRYRHGRRTGAVWRVTLSALVTVLYLALQMGCKNTKDDDTPNKLNCQPAPLEIFLQASKALNQNDKGQSMPTEVRVFLLKRLGVFDQLDFETIWKEGDKVLGKDLVRSESLTVFPGKLKIHPMTSAPGVAYVGLVAIFRRPEGQRWRHVIDVRNQCAKGDNDLHTIIHAQLRRNTIFGPASLK